MKMNDLPLSGIPLPTEAPPAVVFQQLGAITRQLHDALNQLGVMPKLQIAAQGLPDARSRLNYIAEKSAAAAEKVLNAVDRAKAEHSTLNEQTRLIAASVLKDPVRAVATGEVLNFLGEMEAATERVDQQLTEIMLAQDFHDLTGQVMARVIGLASELEDSLVKLLVQAAPHEVASRTDMAPLDGPVVDPQGRTDVVSGQSEVDDLLASMGF
ncbi:MAG: protein phosphatase CheZ [Pseudorhodobacter sp.]|nr:protein phosphatase CheZ [Rhizobacter sp.]